MEAQALLPIAEHMARITYYVALPFARAEDGSFAAGTPSSAQIAASP